MEQLLLWMASSGITFAVCESKILERPRNAIKQASTFATELLECPFCFGFWASLAVHAVHFPTYLERIILGSFSGAIFCYGFDLFLRYLENHGNHPQN